MSTMHPDEPLDVNPRACAVDLSARTARGFSLVSAIFLLVIFGVLGAFMVKFSTAQHLSSAQDMLGSLAYQAAYAGIERGVYEIANTNTCTPGAFVPGASTLNSFTVKVQCLSTSHTEGDATVTVWQVTSTAAPTGMSEEKPGYAERKLQAMVEKPAS